MSRRSRILLAACGVALAASPTLSAQRWGHERFPTDGVCFFENSDFKGDYFCVAGGGEVAAMTEDTNDKISSIRVFGGAEVTVFSDVRFAGASSRFAGDVRNLKDQGWDDRISSVRVRPTAGNGGADVDRMITRAYQEILNRDPDPQGMTLYRNRMLREGWSDDRVRDALKGSPEYRAKGPMTIDKARDIVRRAYLAVLKREPDAGSEPFVNKVLQGWSQTDVERELRNSDEYKRKGS